MGLSEYDLGSAGLNRQDEGRQMCPSLLRRKPVCAPFHLPRPSRSELFQTLCHPF